jgi:hypothetical protein
VAFFLLLVSSSHGDPTAEALAKHMAQKIKQNIELGKEYGWYQKVAVTKFSGEGSISEKHERNYRSIWLQGRLYNELFQIDGRRLSPGEQTEESKRQDGFVSPANSTAKADGIQQELKSLEWWELPGKYDLTLLPADGAAKYVLSFRPKQIKLQERSRIERILNHMEGTVWLDEELNVLKAEARLVEPVRFGFGILANVENAQIEYTQQEHDHVRLPASLHVSWSARIALVSHRRQEIRVSWHDVYPRSDATVPYLIAEEGLLTPSAGVK